MGHFVNAAVASNPKTRRSGWIIPLLAFILLIPCILYVGLRVALPGDGTSLGFAIPPQRAGLPLYALNTGPTGAAPDLLLLAIGDRSVDALLSNLFSAGEFQQTVTADQELIYTVTDSGPPEQVIVHLERRAIWPALINNWTFILDLLLLLAVGLFVYLRQPHLTASRNYFLLSCLLFSNGVIYFSELQASDLLNRPVFWIWFIGTLPLYAIAIGAVVHFTFVFPAPMPGLRRKPRLPLIGYMVIWIPYLAFLGLFWQAYPSVSERVQLIVSGAGLIALVGFPLAIGVVVIRYRREFGPRERRQTRWVLWGMMVALLPWLVVSVLPPLFGIPALNTPLLGILWWALPISFAIAILRENLFNIDHLINRTIVYSLLTLSLTVIYLTSITILQSLFSAISGQQSTAAIVITTLAIAALFTPLRRRIQNAIDRRFYRKKYDAEKALATFSLSVREVVELDDISTHLLTVVEDTLQPELVSLWLIQPEGMKS
jgi:hypothetical protein